MSDANVISVSSTITWNGKTKNGDISNGKYNPHIKIQLYITHLINTYVHTSILYTSSNLNICILKFIEFLYIAWELHITLVAWNFGSDTGPAYVVQGQQQQNI